MNMENGTRAAWTRNPIKDCFEGSHLEGLLPSIPIADELCGAIKE
jgi:hypothetical protein